MTTQKQIHLPFDILDEITSLLLDDKATLCRLSVVSKGLASLCQRYLFRSIHIRFRHLTQKPLLNGKGQSTHSMQCTLLVLEKNRHLARHVQDLSISLPKGFESGRLFYAGLEGLSHPQLALPNLKSFSLSNFDYASGNLRSKRLMELIFNILSTPSLISVKLREVYSFPISQLELCARLQSLEFQRCNFVLQQRAIPERQRRQTPRLKHLAIKSCRNREVETIIAFLNGWGCEEKYKISTLERLSLLCNDPASSESLWSIAESGHESLQRLTLAATREEVFSNMRSDITDFPMLVNLHLSVGHFHLDTMIRRTTDLLKRTRGPTNLKDIGLYFQISLSDASAGHYGSQAEWDELEDALMKPVFGKLQVLNVVFRSSLTQGLSPCDVGWKGILAGVVHSSLAGWRASAEREAPATLFRRLRERSQCKVIIEQEGF